MLRGQKFIVNSISIIAFLVSSCIIDYAQVPNSGKPVSVSRETLDIIPVVSMPAFNADSLIMLENADTSSRLKSYKFAKTFHVNYDYKKCGLWTTGNDGTKVWRLGIRSKGAYSLNILFTKYRLNKGVKLFLYNASRDYVLGAFTDANNKSFDMLAVSPIPGDMIYIELQVPYYVKDAGELVVGKVGHDYLDYFHNSMLKTVGYGLSGSCNVDINCYDDPEIQKIKYSVVRIVYDGDEGCTGTLINNTSQDGKPYVLTAEHCLSTELQANTATFNFNYESPYCDGPDGNTMRSISGATIKATTDTLLDFTLVELSEYPPIEYRPYFSGWSRENIPPEHSYCIHHPWGDVKKIAVDNDSATTASFTPPGINFDANTHWKISMWDIGVTEPGSSGGPLFDQNYRLVGDLSGGNATCSSPRDDYFQKFSDSWADYPSPANQLKYWLDPLNTGVKTLDGFDPYASVFAQADTLSNISAGENLIVPASPSWGYLSGHNSYGTYLFAEKFNRSTSSYIFGVLMNVAKAYSTSSTSSIELQVWNDTLNGSPVYQQQVKIDDFLADTTSFVQLDQMVNVNSTFYVGYRIQYNQPVDTFALYMAADRGLSGLNTAYIFENNQWEKFENATTGGYTSSFDIGVITFDSVPSAIGKLVDNNSGDIEIYPNPVKDHFSLKADAFSGKRVTIQILDLNGKILMSKKMPLSDKELNISAGMLKEGIYFVRLLSNNKTLTKKIAVIK